MRTSRILYVPFLVSAIAATAAGAQTPARQFQPGEWKIDMVATMDNGKTMAYANEVCATAPTDIWKQQSPNMTCDPVQFTQIPDGVRIHVYCKGGNSMFTMEIRGDYVAKFSDGGNAYTATGASVSSTAVSGRPPMTTTVQMKAHGTRVGPCSAAAKP